jgi:GNAT superfamily N-acetyltransferase
MLLTPPRSLCADDRWNDFDCGRTSLNGWLRRQAWRQQKSGEWRTAVVCDAETGAIAGFIGLAPGRIARVRPLPRRSPIHGEPPTWTGWPLMSQDAKATQQQLETAARHQPPELPILLIGRLAVDLRFQGRGVSKALVLFAFRTALAQSRQMPCFGVLAHPPDHAMRNMFYRNGFEELPCDPSGGMPTGSMIVRIAELERNGFA